jgi:hypothetical protein
VNLAGEGVATRRVQRHRGDAALFPDDARVKSAAGGGVVVSVVVDECHRLPGVDGDAGRGEVVIIEDFNEG